ncbi:Major Facilitator Superfamily protein [Aquimixticola soesokkakensis]|uniref:Major Facilitator Superfamily protein n=1 Tax=Aquimixticola soesokkakensis TaxID=1519096 RepID=A0A1Y5TD00_9RHOB|nr:MFS transporter [Aquimixticola soesokkakensis]SLN59151.1 Major Facilitator Superfamily protein [Aquimixticola soesokkakensis]
MSSMSQSLRHARAPAACLAALGAYWGVFAALVPDIKLQAGASDAEFGVALLGSACGGMISMALAPKVSQKLGSKVLPVVGIFAVLAMLTPLFAQSVGLLFLAMLCIGASFAMLDISANIRISNLEELSGMHLQNVSHAMYSAGFGVAALSGGLLRKAGFGPDVILPSLAVLVAFLVASSYEGRGWRVPTADEEDTHSARLPWGTVLIAGFIFFAAFTGENSTESWSALFIERELGAPAGEGGFGPAMLGLVMALGRLAGQSATARLGLGRMILISAAFATLGLVLVASAQGQTAALIGIAVIAAGLAVVVPTGNSLLGQCVRRDLRARAMSRAWMVGFLGFFVGPSSMGMIAQVSSLRVSFGVLAVLVAMIIPATLALSRRTRP